MFSYVHLKLLHTFMAIYLQPVKRRAADVTISGAEGLSSVDERIVTLKKSIKVNNFNQLWTENVQQYIFCNH